MNCDSIELRILRRPQLQTSSVKSDLSASVSSNGCSLVQVLLRNLDSDLRAWRRALYMHPALDFRFGTALELESIIVDECFRHFNQRHVPRDAAVVPPIGLQCRHSIGEPSAVHGNDSEVTAVAQQTRYLA